MGIFRRFRSSSGAQDTKSASSSPSSNSVHRAASSNHLAVPPQYAAANGALPPGRMSSSALALHPPDRASRETSRSVLPWKRDKKSDLQAVPYESTSPNHPVRARAPSIPMPPVATYSSPSPQQRSTSERPPSSNRTDRSSRTSDSTTPTRPQLRAAPPPPPPSNTVSPARHQLANYRNSAHSSVISLGSESFHSASEFKDDSSQEWTKAGGILGKLNFESPEAKRARLPPPSPVEHRRGPDGAERPNGSRPLPQRPRMSQERRSTGDVPHPSNASPTPLKKLGLALSTTSLNHMHPSPTPSPSADRLQHDEVEEIRPDGDEMTKAGFWKGRRTRRTSRPSDVSDRPSSPALNGKGRPTSQVGDRPQPLRRPSSSLFHIPFQRTHSRVSLGVDLESPSVDDGSFQLKSFRHISGASDADGGVDKYFSHVRREPAATQAPGQRDSSVTTSQRNSTVAVDNEPPLTPPRLARPPSLASSIDSQRVSVAAFRKGIRRPSSSILTDADDDDMPLSLSRANLRSEAHLKRDSSALSLTDGEAAPTVVTPTLALSPPEDPSTRTERGSSPGASPLRPSSFSSAPPSGNAPVSFTVRRAAREDRSPPKHEGAGISRDRLPSPPAEASSSQSPVSEQLPPARTTSLPLARIRTTSLHIDDQPPFRSRELSPQAEEASPVRMREVSPPVLSPLQQSPVATANRVVSTPKSSSWNAPRTSPPPPPPAAIRIPEPQAMLDDIKLPPRPDELDDEPVRRSGGMSPSLSSGLTSPLSALDEGVRRISGLWNPQPALEVPPVRREDNESPREEAFDPAIVNASLYLAQNEPRQRTASASEARMSLHERLGKVTATPPMSASTSTTRLFNPASPGTSETVQQRSPGSDRTASPTPIPPKIETAPAPPPAVPHSSFGRAVKKAAEKPRADRAGWASSSDDEDSNKTPPARKPLKSAMREPRERIPSRSAPVVEEIESEDEDEPLHTLKNKVSRASVMERPQPPFQARSQPSRSSLKPQSSRSSVRLSQLNGVSGGSRTSVVDSSRNSVNGYTGSSRASIVDSSRNSVHGSSRPSVESSRTSSANVVPRIATSEVGGPSRTSMLDPTSPVTVTASTSKWSLSSSPSPTISPGRSGSDEPPRESSRPVSRANMPRSVSSDRLRAQPPASGLRQPSPRHSIANLAVEARHTASPASSQSGLTGDSSAQQPMTPHSHDQPSRRSWADGHRPRVEGAVPRERPSTTFDQLGGAVPGAFPYGQPQLDYATQAAMKQQMQAQWMAAASRYFEDAWERGSVASTAQTAPHMPGMSFPAPTYGYSYQQPPPVPPGMYPQGFAPGAFPPGYPVGYPGAFGAPPPQMAFPGMQMGMPGGMPPMGGGSMYGYGAPAQSVFGGEFGPPVAGFTGRPGGDSPGGSPATRARRVSGATDIISGRPASVAHGMSGPGPAARSTPPRPARATHARRGSGLAMSEIGGPPPSSWRRSGGGLDDFEQTPRPKRVTNAS